MQNLLTALQNTHKERRGTVNVLVASQKLESFAFKYAKIHFKENQSGIFSEENYGMLICSVAISSQGRVISVSEVFTNCGD